jgi:hypothetical protein
MTKLKNLPATSSPLSKTDAKEGRGDAGEDHQILGN